MDKKFPRTYAAGFVPAEIYLNTYMLDDPDDDDAHSGCPFDGDLTTLLRNKKFEEVAARLDAMYLEEVLELS